MRHSEYELVWATHPKTPNFSQNARGRVVHLATNKTQGELTLCNMMVSFPYEGDADWTNRSLCVVCDAKVKMFKRKAAEPPKKKHSDYQYTFTINTDASYIRTHGGIAAYAFWIKSSHYKLTGSALITEPVANSSIAELFAVEAAMWTLDHFIDEMPFLRQQRKQRGIKIFLNTDSMFTIRAIDGTHSPMSKHLEAIERVAAIPSCYTIECRHIFSHQKPGSEEYATARRWVNDWCDAEAKKITAARLKELTDAKV